MNVFKLRRDKSFTNDKIKISYSTGSVSNCLSAHLIDEEGKTHHVYWNIHPDRCHQSFSNINEKVKHFIHSKVQEWLAEQEQEDFASEKAKAEKLKSEESKIKNLMDNF